MQKTLFEKLYSINNLLLAWNRIKTGQNIFYKNYYRNIILAYEFAIDKNIKNLSDRIRGGSYTPNSIIRFYIPKSTGLHRPISFLHLEDLIIYQAFANIFFAKYKIERKTLEGLNVFSHFFNIDKKKDLFLFKKWQEGYLKFIQKIKALYNLDYKWVVHFDIAAYFDTISHKTLVQQISPRSNDDYKDILNKCLEKWSTPKSKTLGHGIPQGPIASNLIAEIFFLPIDKSLNKNKIRYIRYVDDIKIFGKTREEVLNGVIILERECKERGLIPQSKKFEIKKADNIESAIGKSPSITITEKSYFYKDENKTAKIFRDAFIKEPMDITKIKYILKTIGKNKIILRIVLKKLNQYPELSLEFCEFLKNYYNEKNIANRIFEIALNVPSNFEFVEGNYWNLLSNFNIPKILHNRYVKIAIPRLKSARLSSSLRLGIYKFIASNNRNTVIKWIKYEKSSLLQMMAVQFIDKNCHDSAEYLDLVNHLLKRSNFEPALNAYKELIYNFKFEI